MRFTNKPVIKNCAANGHVANDPVCTSLLVPITERLELLQASKSCGIDISFTTARCVSVAARAEAFSQCRSAS
jgi:hypothetical protein